MKFLDLHYHASPDLYPRAKTALEAAKGLQRCGGAAVLKSHLGSTVDTTLVLRELGYPVHGSLVLNGHAGGIHHRIVALEARKYAAAQTLPLLVFFPTITHHQHPPRLKQTPCLAPVPESLSRDGRIRSEALEVLRVSKDYPIRFASGHSSKAELLLLAEAADKIGIDRLLVNHPTHPCLGLGLDEIGELACHPIFWFELTGLSHRLRYQSEEDFRQLLLETPRIFLSSDFGQLESPSHEQWHASFDRMLTDWGLGPERRQTVFRDRPLAFMNDDLEVR